MKKKEKGQKEFIEDLRKEVNKLENEVQDIKKTNFKRAVIKNVRIFGKKARKWAPIMAASVLVTNTYVSNVGVPFFQTPVKAPAYIQTTQDTLGNLDVIKQYDAFASSISYVEITSPWEKVGEEYIRSKKAYVIDNETFDKVMAVVKGELITNFDELFPAPSKVVEEKSNHLDESELSNESYIKIVYYTKDNEDYTVRLRSSDEILGTSFMFLVCFGIAELIVYAVFKKDREKCDKKINQFKEDYKPLDEETLRKELKLKRDNYNTLIGE